MRDSHSLALFAVAALALLVIAGPAVRSIVAQSAGHGRPAGVVSGFAFVALGFLSVGAYALAAGSLAQWLRERRRLLRYASGSIFVGLGVSAALAKRA